MGVLDFFKDNKDKFGKVQDNLKDLFEALRAGNQIEKGKMDALSQKVADIVAWRKRAKTETEKTQADIALDVLTRDIPITIKAMVSEAALADKIASTVSFGLKIIKILM